MKYRSPRYHIMCVTEVVADGRRTGTSNPEVEVPSRLCLSHCHPAAKRAKLHVSRYQCADQQDTRNEREGVFNIYLGPMIVRVYTCAILVAAGKLSLCSPHSQLDLLLSSSSGTNRKSNLFLHMVAAILALLGSTGLIFCRR
jgi:hypothetical protein